MPSLVRSACRGGGHPNIRSRRVESRRRLGLWLLGAVLTACGGDPSATPPPPPPDPLRLEAVTTLTPSATVGTRVSPDPTVRVRDSRGPRAGIVVRFDFPDGASTVATSDAAGEARIAWTLRTTAGVNPLAASVDGGASVTFQALGVAGPAARVALALTPEAARVGSLVTGSLAARVTDQFDNPVAGAPVHFEARTGGGTILGADPISEPNGLAAPAGWQTGPSDRVQRVLASAGVLRDSADVVFSPASVFPAAPVTQRSHVGRDAPSPAAVRTLDAVGQPMAGVPVSFTGSGVGVPFSRLGQSDAAGIARVPDWVAAPEPGDNIITATVPGHPAIPFVLTGVIPGPARAEVVSGAGQRGTAGNFLGPRPTIRFYDSTNTPIPRLPVDWAVTGGGSVLKVRTLTDETGLAANEGWRLGPGPGAHTLTATAAPLPPIALEAVADPPAPAAFSVEIRITGVVPVSAADSTIIVNGAYRWLRALRGDLPDVHVTVDALPCDHALDETIDDLLILVEVRPGDGVGKELARGGPCLVRSGSLLTAVGVIYLDELDTLNQPPGVLDDIISHEIGHVLGIGTLWDLKNLTGIDPDLGRPGYTGHFGRTAFHGLATDGEVFYKATVPLENPDEPTAGSHWGAATVPLSFELMTAFFGETNVLSALSVAALRDLGYQTIDTAAEPFSFPAYLRSGAEPVRRRWIEGRLGLVPRIIDERGRVTPLP